MQGETPDKQRKKPERTIDIAFEWIAPLIKKFLSPRGDVVYDARTNTLIITDID